MTFGDVEFERDRFGWYWRRTTDSTRQGPFPTESAARRDFEERGSVTRMFFP
jgi:hypothetical protein